MSTLSFDRARLCEARSASQRWRYPFLKRVHCCTPQVNSGLCHLLPVCHGSFGPGSSLAMVIYPVLLLGVKLLFRFTFFVVLSIQLIVQVLHLNQLSALWAWLVARLNWFTLWAVTQMRVFDTLSSIYEIILVSFSSKNFFRNLILRGGILCKKYLILI